MKFLISAGPTREMIDEVRFLSNLSSGRTGFAVAAAARDLSHDVTLVSGPVALSPPSGIIFESVTSALEMQHEMVQAYGALTARDAVIMTAAVCDYRPAERVDGKMKKGDGPLSLRLERNPDILADLGDRKRRGGAGPVLIGFALEVQEPEKHALGKLERKNLDLIVLNGPANFGSDRSRFRLVSREGIESPRDLTKGELGRLLVERAGELASG